MTFGEDWGWGSGVEESKEILDRYIGLGGNFIDTANGYTKGHSEAIIGEHIGRHSSRRDRLVIATKFLTNMYRGDRADFVYTVSRDFVRNCQTPILVLPDDVPGHPYVVAMESVYLAPNAQVSLYPWKANPKQIQIALRHVRGFLRDNRPVASPQPLGGAAQ